MRTLTRFVVVAFLVVGIGLAGASVLRSAQGQRPAKTDDQKDTINPNEFSDTIANTALSDIREGLEGHSQRQMLSVFDPEKMDGYLIFKDQIQAFFETYESFRVHYRIAQTTSEDARGIALVDFELEETPRGANAPPQRKSAQLRFEFERGTKGWKIKDFSPRNFFS